MRIVILTYESSEANHIVERLVNEFPGSIVGVGVSTGPGLIDQVTHTLRRLVASGGWGFVVPKTIEVLAYRIVSNLMPGRFGLSPSVRRMTASSGIPLLPIKRANSSETLEGIAALGPDLLVSVHFDQILKSPALELPRLGTLNVHGSLLPRNRGLFPYFWALSNGDNESGVTVHWIDPGIDTGAVVAQVGVGVLDSDSVSSLARRCASAGASLLVDVLATAEVDDQIPGSLPQQEEGNYVSWPDRVAVRRLRERGRRYGPLLRPIA